MDNIIEVFKLYGEGGSRFICNSLINDWGGAKIAKDFGCLMDDTVFAFVLYCFVGGVLLSQAIGATLLIRNPYRSRSRKFISLLKWVISIGLLFPTVYLVAMSAP